LSRLAGRRSDSGAAAVEFALLFPVFAMVVLGTITFGFAFESWLNVTSAARETSRFAATYPIESATPATVDGYLTLLGQVAADNAGITLTGANATPAADYLICVKFIKNDTGTYSGQPAKTWGTLRSAPASCTNSTLPDNRVEVSIERRAPVTWGLGGSTGLTVRGKNTSRYEPEIQ
jgi:Flp pilus assembly protein TadG